MQQRLSRKQVHQAFDDLLANAGQVGDAPTDGRGKMPQSMVMSDFQSAVKRVLTCHVVRGTGAQTEGK